jgi:hypothetical protein
MEIGRTGCANVAMAARSALCTKCAMHHTLGGTPMTWFKVDDSFHSHPKVLAASPAALGLWVVAGSWSGANLSDGFIPDHVLPRLLPDSASLARDLVTVGLWKRARGGYRFHNWGEFNPAAEAVQAERAAARERMRAIRARRKEGAPSDQRGDIEQNSKKGRDGDQEPGSKRTRAGRPTNGSPEQPANVRELFATPTRPDPILGGALGDPLTPRVGDPPSPRCEKHRDTDGSEPCGPCGDARRARTRWEVAEAERISKAPKCPNHRGQLADNCALCRSEDLGEDS